MAMKTSDQTPHEPRVIACSPFVIERDGTMRIRVVLRTWAKAEYVIHTELVDEKGTHSFIDGIYVQFEPDAPNAARHHLINAWNKFVARASDRMRRYPWVAPGDRRVRA